MRACAIGTSVARPTLQHVTHQSVITFDRKMGRGLGQGSMEHAIRDDLVSGRCNAFAPAVDGRTMANYPKQAACREC
jgi:hypothetical protein